MARKRALEVTPLGPDPDPLAREGEALEAGDLLGKIFDRERSARLAAAREDAASAVEETSPPLPDSLPAAGDDAPPREEPVVIQDSKHASLQESNTAIMQDDEEVSLGEGERRRAAVQRAAAMGASPLRDVASRLPVELDRWLERIAFEYEQEHGTRMPKQTLLRLAVQRLFIDTEILGSLPALED